MTVVHSHSATGPRPDVEDSVLTEESRAESHTRSIPVQRSLRPRARENDEAYLRSLRAQADTDIAAGR